MAVVTICTPHAHEVNPEYWRRIMHMQNATLQHQFAHVEVDLMIIGKARNILVQEVNLSAPNCEVIWYIDNDVWIPPHSGQLIDQAIQYGIVSGLYFNRWSPYTPQMYNFSGLAEEQGMYEAIIDYPETGFIKVDAVGAGCLAIRRDVLEKMKAYYDERLGKADKLLQGLLKENPLALQEYEWLMKYTRMLSPWFEFLDQKGEDFYFCERAAESDYMIWVNLDVKCEHIAKLNIMEGHFKYLKDQGLLVRLDPEGNPMEDRLPKPQTVEAEEPGGAE